MKSEKFKDLLSKKPDSELFRFSLAQALWEESSYSEARDHFETCLQKRPDWMMAAILKAKCELALGEKSQAKLSLQSALKLAIDQEHEAPEAEVRKMLDGF